MGNKVEIGGTHWESLQEIREFTSGMEEGIVEYFVKLFQQKCCHPGNMLEEERRMNQAWLTGYCQACEQRVGRAYCAQPGYGMPEGSEELPDEAYEWARV